MQCKIGGRFLLEVLNSSGEIVRSTEVDNMILDGALTRWAAGGSGFATGPYFCVGTGTTAVAANQTSLANFLAGSVSALSTATTLANEHMGSNIYRAKRVFDYTYGIGTIVGNISEIGANWATASQNNLDSRALITDIGGTPTTLTILASEQLRITYTVYMDINPAQSSGTITLDGVSTNYVMEKLNAHQSSSWQTFLNMSGTSSRLNTTAFTSSTASLYNSVSATTNSSGMTSTTVSWTVSSGGIGVRRHVMTMAVGAGNISGGIRYLMLTSSNNSAYHMLGLQFTPNINKVNTKTLTLTFDITLTRV